MWRPIITRKSTSLKQRRSRALPRVEELESRLVPYALSGDAWPHPQLITISFVPDGTLLGANNNGYIYSNLSANLTSRFGSVAAWQNQILKAAQWWAQQTNINFTVVADDGSSSGSGSYQQGASNFGDIRIGGYNFGSGNTTLALAYMPPPDNNFSVAGDINFNTGQPFNNGTTYDLASVAAHEIGHAIGLSHTTTSSAVMYAYYTNVKRGLATDDVNGARAIYNGARTVDTYDTGAGDNSFATAANLTSLLDPTALSAAVNNLNIASTSDVAYYSVTAPSGTSGNFTVTVQSAGLSLLAPTLTVYGSDQVTVLGSANGAGQYGTTLSVTVSGVTAGQQLYVKVAGADTSAFGTGAYALTLNFGTGPTPSITIPNTQTLNGSVVSSKGGQADSTVVNDDYPSTPEAGDSSGGASAAAAPRLAVAGVSLAGTQPTGTRLVVGSGSDFVRNASTVVTPAVFTLTGSFLSSGDNSPSTTTVTPHVTTPAVEATKASGSSQEQQDNQGSEQQDVPAASPAMTPEIEPAVLPSQACDACFADQSWQETPHHAATLPVVTLAGLALVLAAQQRDRRRENWLRN